MRQAGVLAAAGLLSLTVMADRVKDDHTNAYNFAKGKDNVQNKTYPNHLVGRHLKCIQFIHL